MITKKEFTCEFCGKSFWRASCYVARTLRNGKKLACSRGCSNRYYKKRAIGDKNPAWTGGSIEVICPQCCKVFKRVRRHNIYCSKVCYANSQSTGGESLRNNRNQPKYRKLAALKLGRELYPNEVVHHIDGNYRNNSPGNLEVLSLAAHTRLHGIKRHTNRKNKLEAVRCA